MMRWLLLAACLALPAAAQEDEEMKPIELQTRYTHEDLTNGLGSWEEVSARFVQELEKRTVVYGGGRWTRRFGLDDGELHAGGYTPLGEDTTANFELAYSPTHQVLAQVSALASVNHQLGDGWGIEGGYNFRQYDTASVNLERFTLEKYVGDSRIAYSLWLSQVSNAGNGASHVLQYSWYPSEGSSLNLAGSVGREPENVGPPRGVIVSDTKSLNLWGTARVSDAVSLALGAGIHRQGDLYTRRSFTLGLDYRF